ncbi:MAG: hypothetical protein ABIU97_09275 [Dehalococcoidia bacterium]
MPARTDRIHDDALRTAMQDAKAALKAGDYKRVVECSSEAYAELLRRKPDMLRGAEQIRNVLFFPRLGAHLVINGERQPEVIYDRETFSFSEAVTYFEFAVDNLVKHEL